MAEEVYRNEEKQAESIVISPFEKREDFTSKVKNELTGGTFADDSRNKPQIGGLEEIFLLKANNETVNNSAILQDDDTFTFYGEANVSYAVIGIFYLTTNTTARFKWQWSLPSGATFNGQRVGAQAADTLLVTQAAADVVAHTANGDQTFIFLGIIKTGTTAGKCTIQWAQNTATAIDTTLYSGSLLRYKKIINL